MLIATQSRNVESTSKYFDQVLTQGDYYLGQEINARWQRKGADRLTPEERACWINAGMSKVIAIQRSIRVFFRLPKQFGAAIVTASGLFV